MQQCKQVSSLHIAFLPQLIHIHDDGLFLLFVSLSLAPPVSVYVSTFFFIHIRIVTAARYV